MIKDFLNLEKFGQVNQVYIKLPFYLVDYLQYIGSSRDLGARFKYHFYMASKVQIFLGYFIKVFGWEHFSITVLEKVPVDFLEQRENWYLKTLMPLLNIQTQANVDSRDSSRSPFTKQKLVKQVENIQK